jgi:hypothetical protein
VISCPYCGSSVVVPKELWQGIGAKGWSTILFDGFTANHHNWPVGDQAADEYFANLSRTIASGRYHWEGQVSRPSSIAPAWLMGYPVSDFHLSVNCKHIRGSRAGSSWGIIFRIQDNQNYYCFRVADTQFFAFSINKGGQWLKIMDSDRTDAIKPDGVNRAEVIAHATHFTFLVNGQVVHEIDDDRLSQGLVGLAIEAYTPGEAIAYDFLDITLRAPY